MRYFIVFYNTFNKDDGLFGSGCATMQSDSYLNQKQIRQELEGTKISQVVFTNIIELTKEDYESWIS